jgi:hypothetical protein
VELESNSWKQFSFDMGLSGGVIGKGRIDYEELNSPTGTCRGSMQIESGVLLFVLKGGDGCRDYQFVKQKPTDCIENPIENSKATVSANEKEIETLIGKMKDEREADRKVRAGAGSKAMASTYPHPCNNLDPDLHSPIEGREAECMPISMSTILANIEVGKKLKTPSWGWDDDNLLSFLISPSKKKGEESKYTKKDRRSKASEVKKVLYKTKISSRDCKSKISDSKKKVTLTCSFDDNLYVSGSAYVKRTQKCETDCYRPGSCGTCSSHSDCSGWTCGCSSSRCTYMGYCTACPRDCDKTCEDPEFKLKGVLDYTFSTTLPEEQYEQIKKNVDTDGFSSNFSIQVLFNPVSAYRKVFTKDGDVEHTTSFHMKIKPKLMWIPKLDNMIIKQPISMTFQKDDISIACKNGECTSKIEK